MLRPLFRSTDQVNVEFLPSCIFAGALCGPGLMGLGVTALIAGFMSGMAGNVSAFSTVWTYDIYGAFLNKKASDRHYVAMGRWCTLIGVLVSVGTAYLVQHAASIMDYVQRCSASSSRRCLAR